MSEKKRSLMAVFVALLIIIVGLLMLCSQRASINQGQDLATDDDAFRDELLEMLDLADDTGTNDATLSEFETQEDAGTADDVLSLLAPETEQTATLPDPVAAETTPTTTADNMGLTEDMFAKVQRDVNRLEGVLETRSQAVDSLRRIVENRNARIRELESRMVATPTSTYRPPAASSSRPVSSVPISSGFMAAYQNARQQFESYNYQAAISSFESLLANNPNHQLADNCQYWIGECYYGLKQYPKALLEFQKVFGYSQADKHDDAQLMIAMCYVKQGERNKANQEFGTFLNTYSGSEYTSIAQRYYSNI